MKFQDSSLIVFAFLEAKLFVVVVVVDFLVETKYIGMNQNNGRN